MNENDELIIQSSEEQQLNMTKKTFQKHQTKKKAKLISDLATQLANIPQLIEQFSNGEKFILDISKELAEKIANGELEFISKVATGEAVGILKDPSTGRFYTQLPIKEMPLELGASIANAGLSLKMQEISHQLEVLESKINRVNRNFDLNRYAEVYSALDKYKLALLIKDSTVQKTLLLESLSQATTAKNLFLNQLNETKSQLTLSQESGNKFTELISINKKSDEQAELAQSALENLDYMKDAFSVQIATLADLGEYEALHHVVSEFKDLVIKDFSGDDALFLDGHLPPPASNPFKYLSEKVIESSNQLIEFIDNNENFLEMNYSSTNSLLIEKERH